MTDWKFQRRLESARAMRISPPISYLRFDSINVVPPSGIGGSKPIRAFELSQFVKVVVRIP